MKTNKNHIESYQQSSIAGVTLGAFNKYERLEIDGGFDALEHGYLYIYVANETALDQEVYFDDIKVTHESALANFKVSQVNEYYPYGLPTSNSWRNEGYMDPGLLYQSSFASYDSLTGYYDFLSRSYDPATGRFFAVDPAGQFSSPYVGMGNLPHWGVDPNGETFLGAIKAIGGFLWGGLKNGFRQSAFSTGVNYATGGSGFTVGFSNNIPYGGGPGVGLGTNRDYGLSFSYSTYGFNGGPLNGSFGGVSGMGWGVPDSQGIQTYPTVANAAEQGGMMYMDGRIRDYSAEWGAVTKVVQAINTINPIAIGANSISAFDHGYDLAGNRVNGGQATFNLATAVPFFRSAKYLNGGIKWMNGAINGGKTFAQLKAARGGTQTLTKIATSTGTQRISTEFHHVFLTQRLQKAYNLPNWAVNNRLNVWKLNTVQHSLIDRYRYNFLRAGFKPDVGFFGKYNFFTRF